MNQDIPIVDCIVTLNYIPLQSKGNIVQNTNVDYPEKMKGSKKPPVKKLFVKETVHRQKKSRQHKQYPQKMYQHNDVSEDFI